MMDPNLDSAEHGLDKALRYAALSLDGFRLLLPQNEIHTLESVEDIGAARDDDKCAGWINLNDQRWPIYCLSADLQAMAEIPTSRRICVLLEHEDRYLGLACAEVVILERSQVTLSPLPACMRATGTPIRALAVHEEQVLCVSCAAALASFSEHPDHEFERCS